MKKILITFMTFPLLLTSIALPVAADDGEIFSTDLNIGRDAVDIGDFIVTVAEDEFTFTYQIDETGSDWRLEETHLYLGDEPPAKSAPGRFPYKNEDLGGAAFDEYTFAWDQIDTNGDGLVYVAAHAQLVRQAGVDEEGNPVYEYETTWAQGNYPIGKGKNWATYFELTSDSGGGSE